MSRRGLPARAGHLGDASPSNGVNLLGFEEFPSFAVSEEAAWRDGDPGGGEGEGNWLYHVVRGGLRGRGMPLFFLYADLCRMMIVLATKLWPCIGDAWSHLSIG